MRLCLAFVHMMIDHETDKRSQVLWRVQVLAVMPNQLQVPFLIVLPPSSASFRAIVHRIHWKVAINNCSCITTEGVLET